MPALSAVIHEHVESSDHRNFAQEQPDIAEKRAEKGQRTTIAADKPQVIEMHANGPSSPEWTPEGDEIDKKEGLAQKHDDNGIGVRVEHSNRERNEDDGAVNAEGAVPPLDRRERSPQRCTCGNHARNSRASSLNTARTVGRAPRAIARNDAFNGARSRIERASRLRVRRSSLEFSVRCGSESTADTNAGIIGVARQNTPRSHRQPGVGEDAVAHGIEELQGFAQFLGVAAVAAVEQPLRPLIARPHCGREWSVSFCEADSDGALTPGSALGGFVADFRVGSTSSGVWVLLLGSIDIKRELGQRGSAQSDVPSKMWPTAIFWTDAPEFSPGGWPIGKLDLVESVYLNQIKP